VKLVEMLVAPASLAVQVTVVTPIGNVEPEAGVQLTWGVPLVELADGAE
jgi:hypothetical protein